MEVQAKTDYGKIRQINQDFYKISKNQIGIFPNIFLIADGVGSNMKSGYASKHSCEFIFDQLKRTKIGEDYIEEMSKALTLANTDLFYRILANSEYTGMGTTMVLGTIDNDRLLVANVGDSRCYHIRGDITQITRDHSVAEELVREDSIVKNSDVYNKYKHQLTRAIGAEKKVNPDFFEKELAVGDYILFCTDGLTNMVSDNEIYKIVTSDISLISKIDKLIDTANENGGLDNIAIILIYIDYIDKSMSIFEKEKQENRNENKKIFDLLKEKEKTDEDKKIEIENLDSDDLDEQIKKILDKEKFKTDKLLIGRSRKKKDKEENNQKETTNFEKENK